MNRLQLLLMVFAAVLTGCGQGGPSNGEGAAHPDVPVVRSSEAGRLVESVSVGRNRAVVSVPDDWARGEVRCGVATADTVIFESAALRACAKPPSHFDTITIGSATTREPAVTAQRTKQRGIDVYSTETRTSDGFTVVEKVVPSLDAWFLIRTKDADLAHAIGDYLRVLPENQTTMPDVYLGATGGRPGYSAAPAPAEVKLRLKNAGLRSAVRFVGAAGPKQWSSLSADAEPGVVMPAGATVTVTYSVGTKRK